MLRRDTLRAYHCRQCFPGETQHNGSMVPARNRNRRAVRVCGYVNRLFPPRSHQKRTEGLAHPQKSRRPASWDLRDHPVLVESVSPAPAERAVNLVGSELGEPHEASDQQSSASVDQTGTRRNAGIRPKIRIPKSPYGLNLK